MLTRISLVLRDIRFALRGFAKRPAFTAITVTTLALGVGANTAIFSVVHGVLLKPLPYDEPEGLIIVQTDWRGPYFGLGSMSFPDVFDLEAGSPSIESLVSVNRSSASLTGLGTPEVLSIARVTNGLMETFRVAPLLGRDLRSEESGPDPHRVAVVSHAFWSARFGGREDVIGETLSLNGFEYEVVGVAPPGFDYPDGAPLWIPRHVDVEGCGRGCHTGVGVGRLKSGATIEQAQSEMDAIAANLEREYPETNTHKGFLARSLQDEMVGDVRRGLLLVLGAVGLVVLIACANVANLLLVRASARSGETAIRTAMGASRGRLVAQALVESAVLASLGGLAGVLLAAGALAILPSFATEIPRMEAVALDGSVLAFAFVTLVLVTLLFGAAPALALARAPARTGLTRGAAGASGAARGTRRFQSFLLAFEMAMCGVLLIAAGLLLKSFAALYAVDLGFETRNIVRFSVMLPESRYDELPEIRNFYRELEASIAKLPGVEAVGSVWGPPLGRGRATGEVRVAGRPKPAPGEQREASIHAVGPGWFETMRIRLVAGRNLSALDDASSLPVAVANEAFIREVFPDEDPIGQQVEITVDLGFGSPEWTIVGVVGDTRAQSLSAEPEAKIYVPHGQYGPENMSVTVRTAAGAPPVLPAIRTLLHDRIADAPMYRVETLETAVARQVAPTRFYLSLIGSFAALAALLAAVGLYGVVSYTASRRFREIGLRYALGAPRARILGLVLRQGLAPAMVGLAVGLLAALLGGRVMEAVLFGVTPEDPWIFAGTTALLVTVAVLATLVPAQRASRIDPARALRLD